MDAIEILVVDDERFSLHVLEHMLSGEDGLRVVAVGDADEALRHLAQSPSGRVGCLITDLVMPGLSGIDLLYRIRVGMAAVDRDLPVLMMTGRGDAQSMALALMLDCSGVLIKPATREKCLQSVRRVLAEPRAVRPAADYEALRQGGLAPSGERRHMPVAAHSLPLDSLHDGMILAADLSTSDGTVLMAQGMTLTGKTIAALRELAVQVDGLAQAWVVDERSPLAMPA
ncbi:MAG: CheY-like [Rhodospirillaceae bacterium]|nr:MAG: CheY-like [Rhodospirillaceae bacterium]TNC96427.1 MAG: CheY-like receiver [Stygiobacter sp.]